MTKKLLFTIVSILISFSASAKGFNAAQSNHCGRYFSAFEKKYKMPTNMLRAISVTESGRWSAKEKKNIAWPWTINFKGKGYHYDSKAEAIAAVEKLQAQGYKTIDVGCMQINLRYHPDAFANLEQAFEPSYNIAYAAEFLNKKYQKKGSWETSIRHYHNINPKFSNKYIARIYDTWKKEDKTVNLAYLESPVMYMTVTPKLRESQVDVSDITRSVLETFNN